MIIEIIQKGYFYFSLFILSLFTLSLLVGCHFGIGVIDGVIKR